jgi:hypothetical protein
VWRVPDEVLYPCVGELPAGVNGGYPCIGELPVDERLGEPPITREGTEDRTVGCIEV